MGPQYVLKLLLEQVSDLKMLIAGSQGGREVKEEVATTLGPTSDSFIAMHPFVMGSHVVQNKMLAFFFFLMVSMYVLCRDIHHLLGFSPLLGLVGEGSKSLFPAAPEHKPIGTFHLISC